jgi:hypothetical protein
VALFDGLLNIVNPKKKLRAGGASATPTYNPQQANEVLTVPTYLDHLQDIFTSRQADNAQTLMKQLAQQDPDVSSAFNGYLTLANTEMVCWAEDLEGNVDPEASRSLHQLVTRLTAQVDYSLGFQLKQSIEQISTDLRYMLLMRGGIGVELISDKAGAPDQLRNIDLASIRWFEKQPGLYKPGQVVPGVSDPVMLDQPTFFVSFYRRDPTQIYTNSPFVSAINTIAARQQVINDLYRIMRFTGYPRMEVKVVEEVLLKNAPADVRSDASKLKAWVNERLAEIQSNFASIRVDQTLIHTDAVEVSVLNARNPGASIDVTSIIETLNAQNQAALKTMATILGRGAAGVNTGSVEARLMAMFSDELNKPIADLYSRLFSYCLHMSGFQGFAKVVFRPAELRPDTELEPQRTLKAQRLRQDLSDGIITDEEYTLEMYGRLPNTGAPKLSGTNFLTPVQGGEGGTDPADVSTNSDPLGRSISPDKTKQTKANPKKSKPSDKSSAKLALELLASQLAED